MLWMTESPWAARAARSMAIPARMSGLSTTPPRSGDGPEAEGRTGLAVVGGGGGPARDPGRGPLGGEGIASGPGGPAAPAGQVGPQVPAGGAGGGIAEHGGPRRRHGGHEGVLGGRDAR